METSWSYAVGDLLQTVAGRRGSPGRESGGDNSARRHLPLRGVVVPSSHVRGGHVFDSALILG